MPIWPRSCRTSGTRTALWALRSRDAMPERCVSSHAPIRSIAQDLRRGTCLRRPGWVDGEALAERCLGCRYPRSSTTTRRSAPWRARICPQLPARRPSWPASPRKSCVASGRRSWTSASAVTPAARSAMAASARSASSKARAPLGFQAQRQGREALLPRRARLSPRGTLHRMPRVPRACRRECVSIS